MKTNKSFSKRLKQTKNGKLIARRPGHDHFNARETGIQRLSKRGTFMFTIKNKLRSRFLPK